MQLVHLVCAVYLVQNCSEMYKRRTPERRCILSLVIICVFSASGFLWSRATAKSHGNSHGSRVLTAHAELGIGHIRNGSASRNVSSDSGLESLLMSGGEF